MLAGAVAAGDPLADQLRPGLIGVEPRRPSALSHTRHGQYRFLLRLPVVEGMGFVEGIGFNGAGGQDGVKAPCRWVAMRHALSTAGNDHVYLAVSLVREDGTKANIWNDRPRAQTLAGWLERRHGLFVLESRGIGMGVRGVAAR